mgnify:CR=1 FL=1
MKGKKKVKKITKKTSAKGVVSFKLSKKLTKGTLDLIAVKCDTAERSITSCTEPEANIAKPVWRAA